MQKYVLALLIATMPIFLFGQLKKKVILIGIDGCRPDALAVANTPNMDELRSNGIFSPDAFNDDITISGPGWSAILCGVWSSKHQVVDNSFNGDNYAQFPSLFQYLEDTNPEFSTVSICHWAPINDFIVQDAADYKLSVTSDAAVASECVAQLSQGDPDFLFLHFDDIDHAGHSDGFSPNVPSYVTAIEETDAHIGTVVDAIHARPTYAEEDWLIIISTDHGGLGTSHGGNSIEEKKIFLIASCNSIAQKEIIRDSIVIGSGVINCLEDSIALRFDGQDDNIEIQADPIFNFGENQDFTIECRVRTAISSDVSILGNKDWVTGLNPGFVVSFKYPSGPEWKVNIGDGANRADIDTGGEIADDKWHTLSVSFDRDAFMKLYQDGILLDSADISSIGNINTSAGLLMGADINNAYNYNGTIAEVRLWNAVIPKQSIKDWHCKAIEATHPSYGDLIGYWPMNEGFGNNQVADHSPYKNPGHINGASWTQQDSVILYDYSATPRQTDIVPTILTHFCIPIETNWELDGHSLIPLCSATNIKKPIGTSSAIKVNYYPNPTDGLLSINILSKDIEFPLLLEVYNEDGLKVHEHRIVNLQESVNVSTFSPGQYIFTLRKNNEILNNKRIIIPSN